MFDLHEKVTAVTGAGSGIGAAIAEAFADAGAHVYVLDRDEAGGTQVSRSITDRGGRAEFLRIDVSIAPSCQAAAQAILGQHGRCDVLVNNAGIGHVGTVLTTPVADLDRLYSVNVMGVYNMVRPLLPSMLQRQWGSVINMASISGMVGTLDRFAYCTTKFAVVGMTKSMALDYALSKVRFNAICPGRVETPFVQARLKEYPDPKAAYAHMCSTQALNRMGQPKEIAAAALYLAADESAFVTGSCLVIDGGFSAGK